MQLVHRLCLFDDIEARIHSLPFVVGRVYSTRDCRDPGSNERGDRIRRWLTLIECAAYVKWTSPTPIGTFIRDQSAVGDTLALELQCRR